MVDTVELPSGIVERVLQGLPVVYPTSTLPALGCLPQPDALDSLFELKKRSTTKIVSLGVCDLNQASALVEIPTAAIAIVKKTLDDDLIKLIVSIQLSLLLIINTWSPIFLKIIIPIKPKTKYGKILSIE